MTSFTKEQQLRGKPEKKSRQIRKVSDEAARRNAEYSRVLEEIDQERHPWCEESGEYSFDHSHLIPRNYNNYAYMCVKKNIRRNCRRIHLAWESGRLWELPNLGGKYMEIVKSLDHQYYRQKLAQVVKVVEKYKKDNWLQFSQGVLRLPDWLEELIKDF